jgi:hypothetical protein
LYQPLYVPRPTVQPELYASLRPQTYEGGMEREKQVDRFAGGGGGGAPAAPAALPELEAPRALQSLALGNRAPAGMLRAAKAETLYRAGVDATSSVASVASAAKIGELFQYTVGSVSLPRQRSAMIPIITDPVEVERVSIYNAAVLARNPLNGAKVKNTTGKHLLAGPITVLDGSSYAGDASIDNVPPAQERLISYGVDLQMIVDSTKRSSDSVIQSGEIVKGILHLTRKHVMSQEYRADNKGEKDKALIIEHPIRHGWKLVDTDKPVETTEALYRFQGKVGAGKATLLKVKEEVVEREQYAILTADLGQLEFYSKQGEIPRDVREVLIKAMRMKAAMVDTQRQSTDLQRQTTQITAEQQRIRENIKTVAANTDYSNRLLKKLNDQESEIEKLQMKIAELKETFDKQRRELEDFLSVPAGSASSGRMNNAAALNK